MSMVISPTPQQLAVNSYFSTISSLTPRTETESDQPQAHEQSGTVSGILIYGPVVIFLVLFALALAMQITNRIMDVKRVMTAVIIAFMVAVTPLIATQLVQNGTRSRTRASSDEMPRNIQVEVTQSSVSIRWTTEKDTLGAVMIHRVSENITEKVYIADGGAKTAKHHVNIDKLSPSTDYGIEISSAGRWYDDHGRSIRVRTGNN